MSVMYKTVHQMGIVVANMGSVRIQLVTGHAVAHLGMKSPLTATMTYLAMVSILIILMPQDKNAQPKHIGCHCVYNYIFTVT